MENKRYLKIFSSQSDYESQKDSVMGMPHVVLLDDTKEVVFASENKENEIDYASQPFTLVALEDGTMDIGMPSGATFMNYSLNDGDWVENTENFILEVKANDKVKLKANSISLIDGFYQFFNISIPFNAEGNIMSLLYGDDFKNKKTIEYERCFAYAFSKTNIVSAENLILPATTLASHCYFYMFGGCTSLTTAPELPATTLAERCYYYMFDGCTSLTTAPSVLPATTLADFCYANMFSKCTSLTTSPELPATTLANYCYQYMFYGCSKLNYIKMLATDINARYCLEYWVYGVASSGTFIKNAAMTSLPNGTSGIPNGWDIQVVTPSISNILSTPIDFNFNDGIFTPTVTVELTKIMSEEDILSLQPMCDIIVNVINKDNSLHISDYLWINTKTLSDVMQELNISNINDIAIVIVDADIPEYDGFYYYYDVEENLEENFPISFSNNIQCSINGSDWKWLNGNTLSDEETEPFVDGNYFTIEIDEGDIYKFKGNLTPIEYKGIGTFTISKKCNIKGNIMSLLYGDEFEEQYDLTSKDYAFHKLFESCSNIINANELILPATILASSCYRSMFYGCTSLTTAPQLPATTLSEDCYQNMFQGCTSLTTAPQLPATTLESFCYESMFKDCNSLITAPELLATTLVSYCYQHMFEGCTSLTTAPELPATTLKSGCYSNMFNGCKSLTTAPELLATTLSNHCYYNMFFGCTSLTTPPSELPATTLADYCYYEMFNGCTSLTTTPPQLPATTLAEKCYYNMFNGCTSLTTAPSVLPATTLASYCYYAMFYGCTSLTTAPELPATTLAWGCYHYMFYGCTSLTTAPELPATTLVSYCYREMFRGCTSLTTAPELPATTLTIGCSYGMFNGCSKLNYIKMLATDISASECLYKWVDGVASSGTFIKNTAMTSLPSGTSGIPNGWTVQDYEN